MEELLRSPFFGVTLTVLAYVVSIPIVSVVEGPATLTVGQGGKATLTAGE